MFKLMHNVNFSHERCESPFFFKCDAHVDLIASELTFNVNVQWMRRAAPRFVAMAPYLNMRVVKNLQTHVRAFPGNS